MHTILVSAISDTISDTATDVMASLPVPLSTDEVYEALFENIKDAQEMLCAFAIAGKFLPATPMYKSLTFAHADGRKVALALGLQPTAKYPFFLLPTEDIKLTHEGKLAQALTLAIDVATQWTALKYVWAGSLTQGVPIRALVHLMPWLRQLAEDMNPAGKNNTEYKITARELEELRNATMPSVFPSMTTGLNQVCRSGNALFAQHRILRANRQLVDAATVVVSPTYHLLPAWVKEETNEVIFAWEVTCDNRERARREKAKR